MRPALSLLALGALPAAVYAQQGGVELFVGETLFVGGTRLSATWLHEETSGLLRSTSSATDPDGLAVDRDTVVLGGIFEEAKFQNEEKVPFFGNLPWVGFLFRTNDVRDERRELLIFVTPKILKESLSAGS